MKPIVWNPEKNEILKAQRSVSFEDVVFHIFTGDILETLDHPNQERCQKQQIHVIAIENYVYLVPFVESDEEVFLKTIILSDNFGGNKIKSFPDGFDEETYAKAKPAFDEIWAEYHASGHSIQDFFMHVIERWGLAIKPYIIHFVGEGENAPTTESNTPTSDYETLEAFESGKLKRSKNASETQQRHKKYAEAMFRKDARINVRLSSKDLRGLRKRALSEGIPYQTLIASILHKYVEGRLHEHGG